MAAHRVLGRSAVTGGDRFDDRAAVALAEYQPVVLEP
jgi:hypothetical protein